MSARDDLAKLLFRHGVSDGGGRAADAILAAGYSKPRTIVTLAELEDLPESSVVVDGLETVAMCIGRDLWTMGGDEYSAWKLTTDWFTLPATVLYTPKES